MDDVCIYIVLMEGGEGSAETLDRRKIGVVGWVRVFVGTNYKFSPILYFLTIYSAMMAVSRMRRGCFASKSLLNCV